MLTLKTMIQQGESVELTPLGTYEGTLSSRVYQSLRHAILTLQYHPGQILRKQEICDQLNVSRSPVAEAVTRLASEGLVDVLPQAGSYAARFSMDEIEEGVFIREALEIAAVGRVAQIVTDGQLVMLNRNIRMQELLLEDGDIQGFYLLDTEMHQMIMGFSNYRRLSKIGESSWLQVNRARQLILPNEARVKETLIEHKRIAVALEARDPVEAQAATRDHLAQLLPHLYELQNVRPELFAKR